MNSDGNRLRGGDIALFLLLAAAWGTSFFFIKISLTGLAPAQVATMRVLLGAATVVAMLLITRRRWPRSPRLWGHMLVVAALLNAIPFSILTWAEQSVPSGLASVYNATTPIMTMLATAIVLPQERLRRGQTAGLIVGLLGVVTLVGPWSLVGSGTIGTFPSQLALLGMTASYGLGFAYLRRFVANSGYDAPTLTAVQLTLASGLMLVAAPFTTLHPVSITWPIVFAMLTLGCIGSGLAYVWNTHLVQVWGSARTSTVTYLTPVVGVILGVLVLGERVRWNEPIGGIVVLLGVALTSGVLQRRSPTNPGTETPPTAPASMSTPSPRP